MYELKNVSRVYPKGRGKVAALKGVDLDIPDGEFMTVQGPTGHGKTTFLLMLGALEKPTSGKIVFDGKDLGAMPESQLVDVRAQNFGFIFQNYNLMPTFTAAENVEAALVPLGSRPPSGGPARSRPSPRWGSGIALATSPPSCPVGSSSGWRSPGPWSRSPRSSWPTSRPETSTR